MCQHRSRSFPVAELHYPDAGKCRLLLVSLQRYTKSGGLPNNPPENNKFSIYVLLLLWGTIGLTGKGDHQGEVVAEARLIMETLKSAQGTSASVAGFLLKEEVGIVDIDVGDSLV